MILPGTAAGGIARSGGPLLAEAQPVEDAAKDLRSLRRRHRLLLACNSSTRKASADERLWDGCPPIAQGASVGTAGSGRSDGRPPSGMRRAWRA
jgi:hypothetical protein